MDSSHRGGGDFPMKIIYEYELERDCPIHTMHGVWGGVNPHGEIEMNVYSESDKLPLFSERVIASDGSVGPETSSLDSQQSKTIVRRVHAKLLLNYHTAKAVIEWLEDKVQALDLDGMGTFPPSEGGGPAQ